ncbi:hypothetical protein KKF91_14810 [Myxococcota bacterium]|nr:hypothetical protein [Myxococcota bacterium]MBU1431810.1 hypothetical protein [Myxococcota bacterium]MBU1899602.1 hypothetical protein [Myxococcota bacterium]
MRGITDLFADLFAEVGWVNFAIKDLDPKVGWANCASKDLVVEVSEAHFSGLGA